MEILSKNSSVSKSTPIYFDSKKQTEKQKQVEIITQMNKTYKWGFFSSLSPAGECCNETRINNSAAVFKILNAQNPSNTMHHRLVFIGFFQFNVVCLSFLIKWTKKSNNKTHTLPAQFLK